MTKDQLIDLLRRNDLAVARALLVVYNNQTHDEQQSGSVRHNNGMGFRSCDSIVGTSMAQFFLRHNYLTPKQLAYWRKEGRGGMRIAVYHRQILEAAKKKVAQ